MDDFIEIDHEVHGKVKVHPNVAFLIEKDKKEKCPQRTRNGLKNDETI